MKFISFPYIVRAMPAKPLTPEELADAARLKNLFQLWQKERRSRGDPTPQESVTEALKFGQSAVSQYLNGRIPLNVDAAYRFAEMLGRPISDFSPALADRAAKYAAAAYGAADEGQPMSLACETTEEIGILAAYRMAGKLGDRHAREAFGAIADEFLGRVAAERKKR